MRQLIQQDNVFALFSVVGTNGNLADARLRERGGRAEGLLGLGRDDVRPRLCEVPVDDRLPAAVLRGGAAVREHILATNAKKAKIGVLYQSDDYGKDVLAGFRKGLGAKERKLIVQTVGYDPTTSDVQSQVAQLKASGANTFCVFAFGKFAIQSFVYANKLGWKPQIYVNDVASASSIMKLNPQLDRRRRDLDRLGQGSRDAEIRG